MPFKILLLCPGIGELHTTPSEKKKNKNEDTRFVHFLGYSKPKKIKVAFKIHTK